MRLGLVVLVACALGRIATNDFTMWDDHATLYKNPVLNPPGWDKLATIWTRFGADAPMGLYVPFTYTVWSGLAWMGYLETPDNDGIFLNPYVFHGASLVVHALAVLLVFEIVRKVVRSDRAALLGAAVFAVHPVQVETVAWTSGLKDLLCGMLGFVAVWQFMVSREKESQPGAAGISRRHFAVATVALVLAMLSKPTAMVIPVVAFVIDWLALGRDWRSGVRRLWPWFVLSVVCAVSAKLAQPTTGMPTLPLWTRPFVAGDALSFYLVKLFFPMTLVIDYARTPQAIFESGRMFYTPVLSLLVAAVLVWKRRSAPRVVAGAVVFGVGVSPVLGFTPFMFQFYSTVTDHYLYIPMLGVALLIALMADRFRSMNRFRSRAVWGAAGVVVVLLGAKSFVQTKVWQNDFTLNLHTVTHSPNSLAGNVNIVKHYVAFADQNPSDPRPLKIAEFHAERAVELRPDVSWARDTLATLYMKQGRIEEGIEQTREQLRLIDERIGPVGMLRNTTSSRVRLANYFHQQGRYEEAIEQLQAALRNRPGDPDLLRSLDIALSTTRPAR